MPQPVLQAQWSSKASLKANRPVNGQTLPKAVLAGLLAIAMAGCSTPVLKPAVEIAPQFAAASATENEPEVAWWESYGDPVLSDLIRRAAHEQRDVKVGVESARAAR